MSHTYLRGDMYYADLGRGIGSEQAGYRPVVIVQNNVGNRHSPTLIAAPISTRITGKRKLPTHCYLKAENGLEEPSVVLMEQVRTIDKQRLTHYIGKLPDTTMDGLNHALAVSVGLEELSRPKHVLCLCSTCLRNYYNTGAYNVRRVNPDATEKDTCTYCNQRRGYDYSITPKNT